MLEKIRKSGLFFVLTALICVFFCFTGFAVSEDNIQDTESPVSNITVKDVNLYYLGDGTYDYYLDSGVFYYDSMPREMTVYYKDGTTLSGTAQSFYELTGNAVEVTDGQENNPWGIGRFRCKVSFMGCDAYYYVNVKESPVKSLIVEDVVLYEGIDGAWNYSDEGDGFTNGVFCYDAKPEKVTVIYKDGSALTGSVEEIKKATGYDVLYDRGMEWHTGKQTASASFLGASTKFVTTVKLNPVSDVKVKKAPVKNIYYPGEIVDLTGTVLEIHYTDGKTETCDLVTDIGSMKAYCKLERLGKTVTVDSDVTVTENDYSVEIDLLDTFFSTDIQIKEKSITDAELKADENGFPVLGLTFSDSSEKDARIICAAEGDFNNMSYSSAQPVVLITEEGTFSAFIERLTEGYVLTLGDYGTENSIVTPVCNGINWGESAMSLKAKIIYNCYGGFDAYNGLVATDNIDMLLSFAAYSSNKGKPREIHEAYSIYTATEIQKCVKEFFALDGIDIACSENFNPANNTVKVKRLEDVLDIFYDYEVQVRYPVSYVFANGCFKATYTFSDGNSMDVIADETGRIISYKILGNIMHKHIMIAIPGTEPTFLKTGLTEGVKCSSCGEMLTEQKVVDKLVLGKTEKTVVNQSESTIKLSWLPVSGATGYEVFYKTETGWRNCATTTDNTVNFKNLPSGRKYTFAVRAYVIESGKLIKAKTYVTVDTSTAAAVPARVISVQNNTAVQLKWAKSAGATGYRVYFKSGETWKSLGETTQNVVTFKNLKPGTKYTFAIRPYIILNKTVIWSSYTVYTASTLPLAPETEALSTEKGCISLSFNPVQGGEVYQVYFKVNNGSYKLYRNFTKTGTLNFKNLRSGDTYTFAVRCATKTSGGWVFGSFEPVSVTVK